MARAWAAQVDARRRQAATWSFTAEAIRGYVDAQGHVLGEPLSVSPLRLALTYKLDAASSQLARTLGETAASFSPLQACYELSATYTAMLPEDLRKEWGAYYTPPLLTNRLLDLAESSGVDWISARVLDPACGGGAFLLPVAMRIRDAMPGVAPFDLIQHLARSLRGFELDPFAAWLTQVWLEVTFAYETRAAGVAFPPVVTVGDSLEQELPIGCEFDLVIGNPPYGRVGLSSAQRQRFRRSLFGHANLYGVFTDLAVRWTRPGGVVAFVTPTSFLAGEYFKALRGLLADEAPPLAVDFLAARRGVFEDVLQETMLATYRRGGRARSATVHYLNVTDSETLEVARAGRFTLPGDSADPWLIPRDPSQTALVRKLAKMPSRLADWGYGVSTGPLVWNRFKSQLQTAQGKDTFPLIWAEAVSAEGRFAFRAEKRGHLPYFRATLRDDWLKVATPCVLVQRTTAKEQARRLIAAELPQSFIEAHGAVIVENHLNMVRPLGKNPKVSPAALAAFLNSAVADQSFRCISGSVAVSAFELEALPLPSVTAMKGIEKLLRKNASRAIIEKEIANLYEAEAVS